MTDPDGWLRNVIVDLEVAREYAQPGRRDAVLRDIATRVAELAKAVKALELAAGNPVEERDPAQAGFEAYRTRARRSERKKEAP